MAFVAINVLTVPDEMRETLEARFAGRAGEVDQMAGFQRFELLRPAPAGIGPPGAEPQDATRYLVYTRWDSEADFRAWVESPAFQRGHAESSSDGPASTGSTLWTFEVAEERSPS